MQTVQETVLLTFHALHYDLPFPAQLHFKHRWKCFQEGWRRGSQEPVSTGTVSIEHFLKEGDQLREVDHGTGFAGRD